MRVKSVAERGPTRKCVDVPIAVRLENYLLSYRIISSEFFAHRNQPGYSVYLLISSSNR